MKPDIEITVQNTDGSTCILYYTLCDNPIAKKWYQKIYHLQHVPLDSNYTLIDDLMSLDDLQLSMRQDIARLNDLISLDYPLKETYDQTDFNYLHALIVATQYQYDRHIRDIFHGLHRTLHRLEKNSNTESISYLYAGWGEKEGLLEEKFDDPYQYYQMDQPGDIYLKWSEFGKSPYEYWSNNDIDDEEKFFQNCRAHHTFRAQFSLIRSAQDRDFPSEFKDWFGKYQSKWQERWGIGWEPLYQWGGVPLCKPMQVFDPTQVATIIGIKISK